MLSCYYIVVDNTIRDDIEPVKIRFHLFRILRMIFCPFRLNADLDLLHYQSLLSKRLN